jgi:hypothetical protein
LTVGVRITPFAERIAASHSGGPGALGGVIDPGQRLQRDGRTLIVQQDAAKVMEIAAHGQGAARIDPPKSKAKICAPG